MKSSFPEPRFSLIGSLRTVTAAASGPIDSDLRLKRDIGPYEPVLPRLKEISSPSTAKSSFEEPRIEHVGSLRKVTATASGPTISDARLKKDVESYDSILPRLNKLT